MITHGIWRSVLLTCCSASLLMAQPRAVPDTPDLSPAYRRLADVKDFSGPLAKTVTLDVTQLPLKDILRQIASQTGLKYAADPTQPDMGMRRTLKLTATPAHRAIALLLEGTSLQAMVSPTGELAVAYRGPAGGPGTRAVPPGQGVRLSGYVRSAASGEVLRRARLSADDETVRVESNDDGFYSLLLTKGTHRVVVRSLGYAPFDTVVSLTNDITLTVLLQRREVQLATVAVQANRGGDDRPDLDPRTPDMSVVRLDLPAVKLLPPVLGEADPIRSLALLPGVSLSSDASTAFSVRGGAADQNLFLLDEATVYNPSHVLGFLSTFNADAIDNVTLYKGAIPARFGGRLSSVVDVRQREGNANEFNGSASIGLLAGRGLVEGPLPNKLGSYMIAARRSWADLFTGLASDSAVQGTTAFFYDINAKTNVRLGSTGALLLSGYLGRDRVAGIGDLGAGWGNRALTLRWNQALRSNLFSKLTMSWGDYDYRLDILTGTSDNVRWNSRIGSLNVRVDEAWYLSPTNTIEFGAELTSQRINPGDLVPVGTGNAFNARQIERRNTLMPAAWLGQELGIGPRVSVRYGLRVAGYERRGPATVYSYVNDTPVAYSDALERFEPGVVRDSTKFGAGARLTSGAGLEPRISGRFLLNASSSVKASYARTQQFLLLVSNTNSISPLDVWEPAGQWVRPLLADQYAVGYSATRGGVELSVEGFYKQARNVVDFIDGADILLNPRIETQMVQGQGRAYGLELLARRSQGTVTGWVSYTLGRAEQRIPAPGSRRGGINDGRWYVTPFDKTHNLNVVALRPLGAKWTLGSTFTLATGLPTTFPTSRYQVDGLLVTEYGARNGGRLPLYHRLDLSATRKGRRGEWQFGLLNAYNRFNAQALRFRQRENQPLVTEAVQTSIFGIVPSIAYTFNF